MSALKKQTLVHVMEEQASPCFEIGKKIHMSKSGQFDGRQDSHSKAHSISCEKL